ncbi:hypothetical protein U1Q18_042221 [Sarracenia purpurea var. burkii]
MEEIEASKPTPHSRIEETEISKSPSHATDARMEEIEVFSPPSFEIEIPCSSKSNGSCSSDVTSLDANSHPSEDYLDMQVVEKENNLVYMKLKELVLSQELSDLPLTDIDDSSALNEVHLGERNEDSRAGLFDYPSIVIQQKAAKHNSHRLEMRQKAQKQAAGKKLPLQKDNRGNQPKRKTANKTKDQTLSC